LFYLKKFIKSHGIIFTVLLLFFLIDPYNLGFLFGYLLVVIIFLNTKVLKKLIDFDFVLLLIYSFVFASVYSTHMLAGVQYLFIYALFPAFFYIIGKKIVYNTHSYHEIFYLFFALSAVFSLSAVISVSLNLVQGGFVQTDRTIPMFWNGKLMKATAMGAYLTYNMCIPGLLLNYKRKLNKVFMLFAAGLYVLTLLAIFRLGSRTQLVISILSILVSLLFIIPNQTKKDNLKFIATLIILVTGFLLFFPIDLDADYFSVLGSRLKESDNAGSAGGRTERWTKSIEHLYSHPLGWEVEAFGFSHNMWFDVARYSGIISFILLIIITIRFYYKTYKAIRLNKAALLINSQILVYSISSFMIFFVEPIMDVLFFLFVSYCMFQGMIHGYIEKFDLKNLGKTNN